MYTSHEMFLPVSPHYTVVYTKGRSLSIPKYYIKITFLNSLGKKLLFRHFPRFLTEVADVCMGRTIYGGPLMNLSLG